MSYWIMTERGWRPFHGLNKPCPNSNNLQGVFRPMPLERAIDANAARLDRWAEAMQYEETRLNRFSGDNFNEPLFGAFGERL